MNKLNNFEFWCQKVIPLVYDDSLSYYEVLCKMKNHLNLIINNLNDLNNNFNGLLEAYKTLEKYVEEYFKNLDVQKEIEKIIETMKDSGILSQIVNYDASSPNETFQERFQSSDGTSTYYYVHKIPKKLTNGKETSISVGCIENVCNGELEEVSHFAMRTSSPIVINGGMFDTINNKIVGALIIDGKIINNEAMSITNPWGYDGYYVDAENNLHIVPGGASLTAEEYLNMGAYYTTSSFAGVLINGEKRSVETWTSVGNGSPNPRTMLVQSVTGDYYFVVCGGRNLYANRGLTYEEMGEIAYNLGGKNAICLDGGGSSTLNVNGLNVNPPIDNLGRKYRSVASFIYVKARDKDQITSQSVDRYANELKWEYERNYVNYIADGIINLRGNEDNASIQFYSSNDTTRRGAIKVTGEGQEMTMSIHPKNGENTVVFRAYPPNNESQTRRGLWDGQQRIAQMYSAPNVLNDFNIINQYDLFTNFRFRVDTLNSPIEGAYGVGFRMWYGNNDICDIAFCINKNKTFIRNYYSGSWGEWKEFNFLA